MKCDHREHILFCDSDLVFDEHYVIQAECKCELRKKIDCKYCWHHRKESE